MNLLQLEELFKLMNQYNIAYVEQEGVKVQAKLTPTVPVSERPKPKAKEKLSIAELTQKADAWASGGGN